MEGFIYPPLAQGSQQADIRLFHLRPLHDRVTLSLYSASLQDKPHYEAVSYTWGKRRKRKEIVCNDQLATVPENLYNALRNLRYVDRARTLWVDGICINQVDNSEKSVQIRMMPIIYEKAQTVLAWIGEADDRTQATFSEVRRLAVANDSGTDTGPVLSSNRNAFRDISKDLFSILQRDWFMRIWVIQEVSVCRKVTVVCGPLTIDWDELSVVLFARAVPGRIVDGWRKTSFAIFEQRKDFDKSKRPHLSQLIVRHQDSLATEAEDKIYALLGLADEVSQNQITIDYDMTIQDLYQRVVLSCLNYDQNLSILGSVQAAPTSTLTDLPSWVPDWSVPRKAYALSFHDEFSSTAAIYKAARESKYTWKQPENKSGLLLSGHYFDRIVAVGYADKQSMKSTAFTRRQYIEGGHAYLLWQLSCDRIAGVCCKGKRYVTDEDIIDAYWQTICAGCILEDFNMVREEFLSFYKAMKPLQILHKVHLSSSSPMIMFIMLSFFVQNFLFPHFGIKSPIKWQGFTDRTVFTWGRRMARTSQGYIGLVPATTKLGDCVWLLKGGNVPFILREDGKAKRMIGEAYVHGIMRGEAFNEDKCENIEIV